MLLGGIIYLLPVIEEAHKLGVYVITVDYLPDNIAHKYSDEYCNVSIVDKEAVLKLAQEKQIDGIMSFACDPGVVTAAYVAERMNLPFAGSYESVRILQNKDLFRSFLTENGFNVPVSGGYSHYHEVVSDLKRFTFPLIVKPVDSAGSKGVTKILSSSELPAAFDYAMGYSMNNRVIVEEFIELKGFQSSADCFSINGRLVYSLFSDQIFDTSALNPFVPVAEVYPSTMPQDKQTELSSELQRLIDLLHLQTGIYNIECRESTNGKTYIMEVSPRGGGNHLALTQDMGTGQNVIGNEIRKAVGMPIQTLTSPHFDGVWVSLAIEPERNGFFNRIDICDDNVKSCIKQMFINVQHGDRVQELASASQSLGDLLIRFESRELADNMIHNRAKWIKVNIETFNKEILPPPTCKYLKTSGFVPPQISRKEAA
jgi:biotin carboxylase